jgi:antitoxin component of MazEF toxin-antitoxin module
MSESIQMSVKCQDPGDKTGDVIVELPQDVLAGMDVGIGDSLSLDLVDGAIVLRPIRQAEGRS